jgi:23S rRNA (adenine1618-N6)-methyltransferase
LIPNNRTIVSLLFRINPQKPFMSNKKVHPSVKSNLHPRNKHRGRYDFKMLIESCPELAAFVQLNKYEDESIDFFNPKAVKALNKALLKHYYKIENWDIPQNYLCPPIPGRVDYIHYIADLLGSKNKGKIPKGNKIKCLDIGVGANCIYPILGVKEYGWSFVGSDIDPVAIESAAKITASNPELKDKIELTLQKEPKNIFKGVLHKDERIDLSISNPPFHASPEEAQSGTRRKLTNLKLKKVKQPLLNFGGQHNELWVEGGEKQFVKDMINQSKLFSTSCFWFSTLLSKQSNLNEIYKTLEESNAVEIKTIPMGQGNKISRIIAWTFLTAKQQQEWIAYRW